MEGLRSVKIEQPSAQLNISDPAYADKTATRTVKSKKRNERCTIKTVYYVKANGDYSHQETSESND